MNREEILEKIQEGGGSFTNNEITFYIEGSDQTIWAKNSDKGWSAFLIAGNTLPEDWYINFNTKLGNQELYNEFISKLCHTLGYEIPNTKSKIIEIEIEKVVRDEKTLGMVEAYEKLLIGRDITISK